MKEYRKTATVKAKLFEEGDEDGFVVRYTDAKVNENGSISTWLIRTAEDNKEIKVPYISTLENQQHMSSGFGREYVCIGIKGERWLVEKEIFESTYEEV